MIAGRRRHRARDARARRHRRPRAPFAAPVRRSRRAPHHPPRRLAGAALPPGPARGALINVVGTANVFEAARASGGRSRARRLRVLGGRVRAAHATTRPARCATTRRPSDHALRRLQGRQRGDGAPLLGRAPHPLVGLPAAVGLRSRPRLRHDRHPHAGHEGRRARPALRAPLGRQHRSHLRRGRRARAASAPRAPRSTARASTTCTARRPRSPTW